MCWAETMLLMKDSENLMTDCEDLMKDCGNMTKDNGKVALVTGGGSGIGKASAIALLNDGYSVVISGRREDPLTKTVEENGNSPRILGITCDVGDPESVKNLFQKTLLFL